MLPLAAGQADTTVIAAFAVGFVSFISPCVLPLVPGYLSAVSGVSLTDIREGDVGAILGWGFMPWSGGPFSWLDILGSLEAVAMADRLAAAHGPRFASPDRLRAMAAERESFYGSARPAAVTSAACSRPGCLPIRSSGPDTLTAPSSAPSGPSTGADTDATPCSRSATECAHPRRRTSARVRAVNADPSGTSPVPKASSTWAADRGAAGGNR